LSITVTMRYAHTDEETKTAAVKKIKASDRPDLQYCQSRDASSGDTDVRR